MLHSWCLCHPERVYDFLLIAIQKDKVLFAFFVDGKNCYRQRKSGPMLQAVSWVAVPLVIKGLQKQTYYLAKIYLQEKFEECLLMM